MPVNKPDILILGGGILGSALAWHLSNEGVTEISVIDLDLAGTYSSSELNAGGCRATWWNPVNIAFSWHSLQFYKGIAKEIQFFQKGYLFLFHQNQWKTSLEKRAQYESLGIPVEYLEPQDLKKFIPEFKNLKGISGGTYSPQDGLLDPHLLREFYRQGAKERGVHFLDHRYVHRIKSNGKKVQSVHALHRKEEFPLNETQLENILTRHQADDPEHWSQEEFRAKVVVNCTGAWLPITSNLYGHASPVKAIRRQISLFSSHEEDLSDRGMMVDSSGLYFHPEGVHSGLILAGYSNRDEKPGYRFDYDGQAYFDRKIWLRLFRRGGGQHFTSLKHIRGWAGLYAVGPDKTGILGKVGDFENLYEMGGATGRGVMQSYALAGSMAELIVHERFETLDASPLSPTRFQEGRPQYENLDI